MAVKALATITLHAVASVAAVYRYYKLQSSTADAPVKPDAKPEDPQREAPSGWQVGEPTYTAGDTNSLYHVDLNLFSDGTFQYSNVSLSSAYEAAKEAYNKATSAKDAADSANKYINTIQSQYGYRYKKDFYVYGDRTDYYYPVYFGGGNQNVPREVMIIRTYNDPAPSDWHTETHKGSLLLRIKANYGNWGGVTYNCEILDFSGQYASTVADVRAGTLYGYGLTVWLRGGGTTGAYYTVFSDQPLEIELTSWHASFPLIATTAGAQIGWNGGTEESPNYRWVADDPLPAQDTARLKSLQALATANAAVSNVDVEYYLSTSSTSLSGGSWSTTAPAWVDGKYMWSRTVKTDGAGNKTYSPSQNGVCIAGAKGATGAKGDKGEPGADGTNGTNGADGRGVSSIVEQYYKSTSATSLSDGSWTDTYPGWENGKYIWTRSVITYTEGSPTTTAAVCVTGEKGSTGNKGDKGDTGPRGIDVKSVTRYYYLSATAPTTPSTSWTTTEPTYDATTDANKSLYYADYTTYSSGSPSWSAISKSSSYEAAKQAYKEAKAARERLVSWCSENNQTLIDGAKIYTESIGAVQIAAGAVIAEKIASGAITTDKLAAKAVTANKINVTDLFAQDITAAGTIRGVNLVGAKGSFSEELRVFSGTENSAYRMGLKAGADSFKVGWWNKDDEYDALTSYLGITKSGAININNGVSGISLYAKSNIALETGAGTTTISGSGCSIEALMTHSLEFENSKRVGFKTSSGASSRGIGFSLSDNLLFGSGDEGTTNGMYFYVGAKDTFGVYGGTTKDVRFRSFKADDGLMYIQAPDVWNRTTSSGANVRVTKAGTLYHYSSSSMRYKTDITTKLSNELDPERLYDLKVWQYKYREGYLNKNDQRYGQDIIGFIAEDVKQKYPIAANYDEDGQIENWNVEMIVPAMLKLIQDQKKEIDELKERLN